MPRRPLCIMACSSDVVCPAARRRPTNGTRMYPLSSMRTVGKCSAVELVSAVPPPAGRPKRGIAEQGHTGFVNRDVEDIAGAKKICRLTDQLKHGGSGLRSWRNITSTLNFDQNEGKIPRFAVGSFADFDARWTAGRQACTPSQHRGRQHYSAAAEHPAPLPYATRFHQVETLETIKYHPP